MQKAARLAAALLVLSPALLRADEAAPRAKPALRWLTELAAEAHTATPRSSAAGEIVWASVPGATFSFRVREDGSLEKLRRVASDYASGLGLATAPQGAVVVDREGRIAHYSRVDGPGAGDALRWERALGEGVLAISWSGGERIWATTRDGRLLALATRDGATLTSVRLAARAASPALEIPGAAVVATRAPALVFVDASSGSVRASAPLEAPVLQAPAFVPGADGQRSLVVCGTAQGELVAFDAASARRLWSVALGSRLAGAPRAVGSWIAVPVEDGSVRAYTRSGELVWQSDGGLEGAASLLPAGARVIALARGLSALDVATGARADVYPERALEALRARFHLAMMEGEGAASAAEQRAAQEREAFPLAGAPFGAPALQAGGLVFGTEEGWIYRFDPDTLRPTFRYRAGVDAERLHAPAAGHLLVSLGDELFALAPQSGELLWRRNLGAAVEETAGDRVLAVRTRDRRTELDASDGARRSSRPWSALPEAPAAPDPAGEPGSGWLDAATGALQLDELAGDAAGALAIEGRALLGVAQAGSKHWIAAERDGRIARIDAVSGAPAPAVAWEQRMAEPILDVHAGPDWVLLRVASGALVELAADSGQERARVPLARGAGYTVRASESALLVHGERALRVHALPGAGVRLDVPLDAPALAATLSGDALYWVDREGRAHAADAHSGEALGATALGVRLKAARAVPDGLVVLSEAGEVGFAELRSAAFDVEDPLNEGVR